MRAEAVVLDVDVVEAGHSREGGNPTFSHRTLFEGRDTSDTWIVPPCGGPEDPAFAGMTATMATATATATATAIAEQWQLQSNGKGNSFRPKTGGLLLSWQK
ncbi:hypothetical protein QLQ15_16770 [Lysobacter sp. LF1]|uniref:Uncharacterized protein n=1 Tax=Lysobacter stagni TaxID=3045172 RepID=A0ABT6XKF5_9GAMM|nr:hypothetical protein [Lysobacter sp. LF1]MDI9240559.1 hypothetical protein [Lysobacter sp. LF1]